MLAEWAAWAVVTLHLGYLLYAIFGGFLGLLDVRWLWVHLVSSTWSITVTATAVNCPLTKVEKWLIAESGGTVYSGTFIDHYLEGPIYPEGYDAHVWYAGALVAMGSYYLVLMRRLRAKMPSPADA